MFYLFLTALHPPWRHWYNDVIPPFTKPQDRRKAREEREAERERCGPVLIDIGRGRGEVTEDLFL